MNSFVAIADIHGRFDLLEELLSKLPALPSHKLIFLGDMIDRGPDSYKVVARVKALCDEGRAIALLGNHEDMALDFHKKEAYQFHHPWIILSNGGPDTMRSYARETGEEFDRSFVSSGHRDWLATLPLFHETDKVWFSHAPVPRFGDFRSDKDALIWSYFDDEGNAEFDHHKLAVCGHVHRLRDGIVQPRVYPHITYLDTGSGCAPFGRLTAHIITDGKPEGFIQAVPKRRDEHGE